MTLQAKCWEEMALVRVMRSQHVCVREGMSIIRGGRKKSKCLVRQACAAALEMAAAEVVS